MFANQSLLSNSISEEEMNSLAEFLLEWNEKLFPLLAFLLIALVSVKIFFPQISSRILNLDYKVWFILVSGAVYLYSLSKKSGKQ